MGLAVVEEGVAGALQVEVLLPALRGDVRVVARQRSARRSLSSCLQVAALLGASSGAESRAPRRDSIARQRSCRRRWWAGSASQR